MANSITTSILADVLPLESDNNMAWEPQSVGPLSFAAIQRLELYRGSTAYRTKVFDRGQKTHGGDLKCTMQELYGYSRGAT